MNIEHSQRLEKIESVLRDRLPARPEAPWMAEGFGVLPGAVKGAHLESLTEPCRDLLLRGGKRWRPLLMVLSCELVGGGDRAYPLVPLVEFPHTASLIHDDIEDGAEERRGKPAVHVTWGTDVAINAASWLYFQSQALIDSYDAPDSLKLQLYRTVSTELRRLHLGQAMDIHWHRTPSLVPSRPEYEAMVTLKTGTLSRLAAEVGMLAGGAAAEAESFGAVAARLGVGFQIIDDVRNLTSGNPGKRRGDDIVEGKKSLPVIIHLERHPDDLSRLSKIFAAARSGGIEDPAVEEGIALLESSGAIDEAKRHGTGLIEAASSELSGRYPRAAASSLIADLFASMLQGL